MFPSLKEVRDSLDNSYFAAQAGVEKKAQELYAQNPQAAVKYLNDYSVEKAQQMLARWNQLFEFMVVKYNDMIIKPTDKNGTFEKTQYGLGARPARPGYPEKYAKELVKQSGDKILVPDRGKEDWLVITIKQDAQVPYSEPALSFLKSLSEIFWVYFTYRDILYGWYQQPLV